MDFGFSADDLRLKAFSSRSYLSRILLGMEGLWKEKKTKNLLQ